MTRWMYLSFADPYRPKGSQFLGGAFVEGHDIATATEEATRLGINPGGDVVGFLTSTEGIDKANLNRLLSFAEIERFWGAKRMGHDDPVDHVCQHCNPIKRA